MPEDIEALTPVAGAGAWLEEGGRIALQGCVEGAHACSFLGRGDHHCRVYEARPFECRLYPFLLSREKEGYKIYAHLSCPAVAEFKRSGVWDGHVAAIRAFFAQDAVQSHVEHGAGVYPDYSRSPDELEEVFAFDRARGIWDMKECLDAALALRPQVLSGRAFVNMLAWKDFFTFKVEDMDGHLCVFAQQPVGVFMYWPPLGKDVTPGVVDRAFEYMRQKNRGGSLTRIENVAEGELPYFDATKYVVERRGQEYVYARAHIAALAGGAYRSRRWEVNAFEARCDHWFRPYEDSDFNACAALFDRWAKQRMKRSSDGAYQSMLLENRLVHRLLLSYAVRLGLVGRVVEVDGEVAAYTFGYALGHDIFCVLLEVADPCFKGLPAFIFSRFCADRDVAPYTWINAMDDFAADGLAQSKKLWRPARLEPFYAVIPRSG